MFLSGKGHKHILTEKKKMQLILHSSNDHNAHLHRA